MNFSLINLHQTLVHKLDFKHYRCSQSVAALMENVL